MKAVICGAGIAGLALAKRLSDHGWSVTVAERAPGPRTQGYMIDFFGPGYRAADEMGVLPLLQKRAYELAGANFVDDDGRVRAKLDFPKFQRAIGGELFSIMRPDIEDALRESLPDAVDLRYDTTVTEWQERSDAIDVVLSDGTTLAADVLVGADGIHSTIRERTFGAEGQFFRYLGMHTAAYLFTDPEIHARIGDGAMLTDSVGAMMGLYALRDGRVAAMAAYRTPDPELPKDPRAALREALSGLGWLVPRALEHCPDNTELYYDTVAQVDVPRWSSGRVVLIGDACQAVSLLAGQGASLAIAGSHELAEHLARESSVTDGLAAYEQYWRPIVAEKQRAGRRGAGSFLPATQLGRVFRRFVVRLTAIPFVSRMVSRALSGKLA